jgi:Uma2 family endonuclease
LVFDTLWHYDVRMEVIPMSIAELPELAQFAGEPSAPAGARKGVNIHEKIFIPAWVVDLQSFRRWAHSDEFPETGSVSYLDGEIWVDASMEEIVTHSKVKTAFALAILKLIEQIPLGEFIGDGVLLTHREASLSTEPDGLFYLWSTLESKKLAMIPGRFRGYMELAGTPDLVLEVISDSSVRKDTVTLRDSYWRAGIAEYWLTDARGETLSFEILKRGDNSYNSSATEGGWQISTVLGHQFRLIQQINRLGFPSFVVESRPNS